jgi:uncharacterized membrane protein
MARDSSGGGSKQQFGSATSLGISIGAGAGAALGVAFGNLALGIAIGAGLGATIGIILDRRDRDTTVQDEDTAVESEERNPRWLWWLAVLGLLLFLAITAMAILSIVQSG